MTVDFRRGEWQHLDSAQRFLYRDVMLKTTATPSHWGSFEDVPVDLSREEWPHVDPVQRCLYQDVTLETYSQLCAVEFSASGSAFLELRAFCVGCSRCNKMAASAE
ncbi:zinc finger protein 184 isoform X3 [Bubalus bubalis]|uniref:zinc finger protein 184 isoform X3 n=1 Tax=Bubalus bubalis TaxID=89462 RepID=UPI001E1B7A04|nr:zinc finger protein 184 isoform X3 [Bubalus bubalis]